MKNKVFLHIGMHKTGSSAIQAFLALNYKELGKRGYLFPDPPEFGQPYQTTGGNVSSFLEKFQENNLEEISEYVRRSLTKSNVILSSEALFHVIMMFPDRFFKVFEEFDYQMICYVRRQDNFISSWYNQTVKNHDVFDPSLIYELAKPHDFGEALLKCLEYTEPSKITVRPYEKKQFLNGNIYSDFLNCIGLEHMDNFILPDKVVNPSLDSAALEFRRMLNSIEVDKNNVKNKYYINGLLADYTVEHGKGKSFGKENIFSPNERINIIESYKEKNEKIAKIFLGREDGQLFFDALPNLDEEWQPYEPLTFEKVIDICRYLLTKKYGENKDVDLILTECLIDGTISRLLSDENIAKENFSKSKLVYNLINNSYITTELLSSNDINYIKMQEDGWILESNGKDPYFVLPNFKVSYGNTFYIKIEITSLSNTLTELFYVSDNKGFDSEHRLSKNIQKGYNEIIYEIKTNMAIKNLRFDPGNNKGLYVIHNLEVRVERETSK